MAVPASMTVQDLSGVFVMNKTLSESVDEVLTLQGISWFTRKAIGLATITLNIKHTKDEAGVETILIDQTLTGGIKGTTEERILDFTPRPHSDHIFGPIIGKSRRVKVDEIEEDYLKKGWTADTLEHGLIDTYAESDTPKSKTTWITHMTWGFEEIDGAKRYVRHLKFTGPKAENLERRLVYDYTGSA